MDGRKKLSLTSVIFIALVLGAAAGVIIHYMIPPGYIRDTVFVNGIFYVIGQGFLRFMQMLVVPLVFCSLVCGSSAMGDTAALGKVGVKTMIFYLATTAIAISTAILTANIINPGTGLDTGEIQQEDIAISEKTSLADNLLNIIPKNPIYSLANGDMLPIILFAVLTGVILARLDKEAESVTAFFQQFSSIMMEMTNMVMKLAPAGVFCLIARTFSETGFETFLPLLKYMAAVFLGLIIHCFFTYMVLLKVFTGLNPVIFIKKFIPVMGFAFTTATSNVVIPLSIDTLEKKMGISRKISSFTVPLGATINMDGTAIMQGVAVIFAAQAYDIALGPGQYLTVIATATLASIGTAGVPGVGLITLSMVFASVGLPVDVIALIMGIDRILDMSRTAVNITGDAVCTAIVAYQNQSLQKEIFQPKKKES